MKAGTAPGADGIGPEVLKAVLAGEDGELMSAAKAKGYVLAPLGEALLCVLNSLWENLRIPLLVPVPKPGGDPTVVDDYRGISLMPVMLKILNSILAKRLQAALLRTKQLREEQAGFLPGEEAMGHVVALREVLERLPVTVTVPVVEAQYSTLSLIHI